MSAWVWTVIVLAALKCASALAAIVGSGNTIPAGSLYSTYQYAVLILAYGTSGAVLITTRTRDLRAVWLGSILLLVAAPFAETVLGCCTRTEVAGVAAAVRLIDRVPVVPLLPVFIWLFVRDFPQVTTSQISRRSVRAALATAMTVAVVLMASNLSELAWPSVGAAPDARAFLARLPRQSLYWPLISLVSVPGLVYLGWKTRAAAPADRRRVRIFVAGLLIGFLPISLDVLLEAMAPAYAALAKTWEPVRTWLVFASLVCVPLVTSYSVLIDRVVEVRLVVRSALQYALARYTLYGLIVAPLALIAWYLYRHRDQTLGSLASGAAPQVLAITVAGAVVLLRARDRALTTLDRRFFREQYDARLILNNLADRCRRAASVDELVLLVCRDIDRALHVDTVTVLITTPDGSMLRSPDGRIRPLSRSSGLALLAQGDAMPFIVDLEEADATLRRLPEEERHWLADAGFGLLVPLKGTDGSLLGLIGLGHKRSELPYSREDQLLLEAIGTSVALTVENRRLRESGSSPGADRAAVVRERRPDDGRPASECEECGRVYPPDAMVCDCGHGLESALVPFVLAGKFQFDRRLGRGGMGVVYRALDLELGRHVAIKTLPHLGPENSARLRREAKAMALVQHENLAVIFGAETWLGTPMIVVELLAGGTLAARVRKKPVSVPATLEMGVSLARGVDHLHRAGVLHGDIKPSNIGFTRDEVPKILDFGVATILHHRFASATTTTRSEGAGPDTEDHPSESGAHDVAGTPLYMSPEAIKGRAPRPAFDVWSLCVVLFEAMAGAPPFHGASFDAVASAVKRGDRPDLRDVCPSASAELSVFFNRALSRRPGDRPQTAAELGAELARLRANLQVL